MPLQNKMLEIYPRTEMTTGTTFIERRLTGTEPPRCVDGQPASESEQEPQMSGGSLHPVLLYAIFHGRDLSRDTVSDAIKSLRSSGEKTGVHRGSHKNGYTSDCGFADRMPDILKRAAENQTLITNRLTQILQENSGKLPQLPFDEIVLRAYRQILAYTPGRITIKGEALVSLAEQNGSVSEIVKGDHKESVVFVNVEPGTTLNTQSVNSDGRQAFNLDLPAATFQAGKLGIPDEFSIPASLILYQATEMVLVEDKGKPALPVAVHI